MKPHHPLRNAHGISLVLTLLLLIVFLSLGAFAMQFSGLELRIASNQISGTQALYVAESGLVHALGTINRTGVVDFDHDIAQRWSTVFAPNPGAIPGVPQFTYQVQAAAGTDTVNTGVLTVTATGSKRAQRVLVANMRRALGIDGRGAVYLASDSINPNFNGSHFKIDGNDHDLAGNVLAGGVVKPGIATRTDPAAASVVGQLNSTQIPNVQGLGYSSNPLAPSVLASGGPSIGTLNQMVSDILSRPGVVTINDSSLAGGTVLGDINHPQITHLTAADVALNGHVSGVGVLIADGSVHITGNTDFIGWIIVRGETVINATTQDNTTVLGNATILGSLWTGDFNVSVGGSAVIDYSSAALAMADQVDNGGNPVPKAMIITSWREVF